MKLLATSIFLFIARLLFAQPCDSIKVEIQSSDTIACVNQQITFRANIIGSNNTSTFKWSTNETTQEINYLATNSDIDVSVYARVEGCPNLYTARKKLKTQAVNASVDFTFYRHESSFNFYVIADDNVKSKYWVEKDYQKCDTCLIYLGDYSFGFTEFGNYDVIFMHSQKGCIAYDSFNVNVDSADLDVQLPAYIPNTIVINANSINNERFRPFGSFIKSYEIKIFSRRGNLVFSCNEPDCYWNGRDLKGEIVPESAYLFLIDCIDIYGHKYQYTGTIMVLN